MFSAKVMISATSSSVRDEVTGFDNSTNTTKPVILGLAVGIVELGINDGVVVGLELGATVTKITHQ